MLGHQLPVLPPVADFWAALPEVFAWLLSGEEAPQPAAITASAAETTIRTRVLPPGIPMRARGPLEIIRFAAANHLCVDLQYDGSTRRIEPYSLRETRDGNFVLYATRTDSGEPRSYRIDRMQGASVTDQSFTPRYLVELTTEGPISIPQTASRSEGGSLSFGRPVARPRATRSASGGPVYVYRCPFCGKSFDRRTMDGSLNAHKNPQGYPCPGRTGMYVRTKY
jgi:hypothetical protein